MPYTDGDINILTPASSADLGEGDDRIRELKRQILDRLNSLVADAQVNPMALKANTVNTTQLVDSSVIAAKLAADSVTGVKILDGAITSAKLTDGLITTNKLQDGAITAAKLAAGSVTSAAILDGTIVAADLADGSVATAKLQDSAVTNVKIGDAAVSNGKIQDSAVSAAKLLAEAVTTAKIQDLAVTPGKLAATVNDLFLEARHLDVTLAAQVVGASATVTLGPYTLPGLDPLDMMIVAPPVDVGNVTDASRIKLVTYLAVAYGDSFILIMSNPYASSSLTVPAGTWRIYGIRIKTAW